MSRYCPIVDHRVTYQFCEDCDDHKCKNKDEEKDKDEDKRVFASLGSLLTSEKKTK